MKIPEQNNDKKIVFSNLLWRFAERCGAQLVTFIVSIILARLLDPTAYGTIALMTVFITIVQVFVDSGLGNALIQKKDVDDVDFSTVFFTNIIICFLLYGLFYITSPFISYFFHDTSMTAMLRVLSLTVVVSGLKNVQQAYVSRHMLFKKFFFSTLGGTICAAVVGIILAYKGAGAWALVTQQVIMVTMDTCILWITVKWRPKAVFSLERLKGLFSFGWKMLVSSLLDTGYNNLRSLIIGRMYSSADLGYYNQGQKFPNLIVTNINTSIDSVLFPAMSNVQDEKEHVKNMTRRSIKVSVYIMAPLMMGFVFIAKSLICLILTDKWLECVSYLRIFCITYMFYPIHTANLNAIKALGKSDIFLKLEIWKKVVGMILLLTTMWFGVMAMAYSLLVSSVFSQIINSWPNRKLLGYSYLDQLKDIIPSIFLAVLMGCIIYPIQLLGLSNIVTLVIQVVAGGFFYLFGSIVLKIDSFQYLWGIVKLMKKKIIHRS